MIIDGTSMLILSVPYATIAQEQPVRHEPSKVAKDDEEVTIISSTQRKSIRLGKVKQEKTQSRRKRTIETTSGLDKRRKTLHINSFDELEEDFEERVVEKVFTEGKMSTSKKA